MTSGLVNVGPHAVSCNLCGRTRTLLLFLVYSMPKVEISSPKQMPLIPQTKWVYHVYLCVFFWFSELKQIGSATTNAKGPHQLFFLFVFVCHLFCISTWVCLRVCLFFYFCVVVNITDIQDTKLVTNHDLVCMAHGWAASMYVWLQ